MAWKVAGYFGLDRWLIPALGAPWKVGALFERDESCPRRLGPLPRPVRAVRVEEGRLRDVLRVSMVPEHGERVPIDLGDMRTVEVVDLARGEVAGLGYGHALSRSPRAARTATHLTHS